MLNYSDIFNAANDDMFEDKKFRINFLFTPIVFLSLVYAGYAVLTLKDGSTLTASNLDKVPKLGVYDLYEFKYISKPAQISMGELKRLFEVLNINPALLDNPNDRDKGVTELLKKAQELSNTAVVAARKLGDGFELWGEPLANLLQIASMQKACMAVKDEFSNYQAKYNTPAKLNNFGLTMEQVEQLAEQIKLMNLIGEYANFKSDCFSVVSYVANIEYINLGANFKSEVDVAKASFREIRDSIKDGTSGEQAAHRVDMALAKIKSKYIDIYFEEHKKKRLGIDDAKHRGKIQESAQLSKLKKLRSIEIVSSAKLSQIEQDISGLQVCYELTPEELKTNHICPHCRFNLSDNVKNVMGQLDNIEIRIDDLVTEWTNTLLDTISDPIVASQKEYLTSEQQKAIDDFVSSKALPVRIDDFFVKAINALLKGFEPVIINTNDLIQKLEQLPPMDETTFTAKIQSILKEYTKDKDTSKLRIVVKCTEREGK